MARLIGRGEEASRLLDALSLPLPLPLPLPRCDSFQMEAWSEGLLSAQVGVAAGGQAVSGGARILVHGTHAPLFLFFRDTIIPKPRCDDDVLVPKARARDGDARAAAMRRRGASIYLSSRAHSETLWWTFSPPPHPISDSCQMPAGLSVDLDWTRYAQPRQGKWHPSSSLRVSAASGTVWLAARMAASPLTRAHAPTGKWTRRAVASGRQRD